MTRKFLLHLISKRSEDNFIHALKESVMQLEGAFSFVLLSQKKLVALRDPYGLDL